MKAIGNIFLCWRNGKGNERIPIGVIKKNILEGVTFNYIKEGVDRARNLGFIRYEGFPDVNIKYKENVLEIFGQRLIKSERSDTKAFYDFWGIDSRFKDDVFYMLAYTQGLLPTDSFEFLADFNPFPKLSFVSEITNLTASKISSSFLNRGDELTYQLEPDNKFDSNAVKLFKGNEYLGHIKLIHSRVFHKTKRIYKIKVHSIEKNGYLNRVFILIGN